MIDPYNKIFIEAVSNIDGGCSRCVTDFIKNIKPLLTKTELEDLTKEAGSFLEKYHIEEIMEEK